jgi:dipeptide/tripeptide permease
MSWVDVLLGIARLAALASFVFLTWFAIKGIRDQLRESAAHPDPQRKRRGVQVLAILSVYCVAGVVAFFVGRHFWGTSSGVAFAIGVSVAVWLMTIPMLMWQARKEARSVAEQDE